MWTEEGHWALDMPEEVPWKGQESGRPLSRRYAAWRKGMGCSRARGDYGRASDIDLAVSGGNVLHFALDVEEETSTPLKYDVINLDGEMQQELQRAIRQEGRVLYEEI